MNKYQTFGPRLAAVILDGLILLPFGLLALVLHIDTDKSIQWTIFTNMLYFFYSIYFHTKYGQTLGKKWMNIKVVLEKDESKLIGLKNAIMREAIGITFFILDILQMLFNLGDSGLGLLIAFLSSFGWLIAEFVTMLINPKRRSIHDLIANSVVINISASDKPQRFPTNQANV